MPVGMVSPAANQVRGSNMINLRITRELGSLTQELDSLFDQVFSTPRLCLASRGQAWIPHTDIYETSDEYQVVVEIPGLAPEEIEVVVDRARLLIAGHRQPATPCGVHRVHQAEILSGSFKRVFRLPDLVNPDAVQARCEQGLLTVTLPKEVRSHTRVEVS